MFLVKLKIIFLDIFKRKYLLIFYLEHLQAFAQLLQITQSMFAKQKCKVLMVKDRALSQFSQTFGSNTAFLDSTLASNHVYSE